MPNDQDSWVVLVEMKKTLSSGKAPEEQLRRSVPVVKYLQSLCETDAGQSMRIVLRHVLLAEKASGRFDKDRTRVTEGVDSMITLYKDIRIKTIVGTSVTAQELIDE